jgi:hypothetical protein
MPSTKDAILAKLVALCYYVLADFAIPNREIEGDKPN